MSNRSQKNKKKKHKQPVRSVYVNNIPRPKITARGVLMNVLCGILMIIVGALVVYGIFKYLNWKESSEMNRIRANNTKTIGTVIDVIGPKRGAVIAEYFVDGKRYEREEETPSSENSYMGDHYEVIYVKDDPIDSKVDFSAPVFLKGEYTKETNARVFDIYNNKIGFIYNVGTGDIKRWQRWPEGKPIDLKKGDYCQIEFLVDNPRKARLKF